MADSRTGAVICASLFMLLGLCCLLAAPSWPQKLIWFALFSSGSAVMYRLGFASMAINGEGVTVENVFRPRHLRWEEIERFELRWWYAPPPAWFWRVCTVRLRPDAQRRRRRVPCFGVSEPTKKEIETLNAELEARRLPPSPGEVLEES